MKTSYLISGIIIVILIIIGLFYFAGTSNAPVQSSVTGTSTEGANMENENSSSSGGMVQEVGDIENETSTGTNPTPLVQADTSISASGGKASTQTVTVTYRDAGFSPSNVTIHIGDTVKWVNDSSVPMWVASGVHPTHTLYDGTSLREHCHDGASDTFDSCHSVPPGGSYSFSFGEVGVHPYHNHLSASDSGKVTVQ